MRLFLLLLAPLALGQRVPGPQREDWDWLTKHRAPAFEALMPMDTRPVGTWVAYRAYRDLYQDVREDYFAIRLGGQPGASVFEAVVVAPVGDSIQQQLLALHMRNRTLPFSSVLSRVTVRRHQTNAEACPAVQTQLDALTKVTMTVPSLDGFVLHPHAHRLAFDVPGGSMDATINDGNHPLVRWAQTTLRALLQCAK